MHGDRCYKSLCVKGQRREGSKLVEESYVGPKVDQMIPKFSSNSGILCSNGSKKRLGRALSMPSVQMYDICKKKTQHTWYANTALVQIFQLPHSLPSNQIATS